MKKKPLFDSPEGRKIFSKMQDALDEIDRLYALMHSKDPIQSKKAGEQLEAILKESKKSYEKAESGQDRELSTLQDAFSNPDHFTPEQQQLKLEIEERLRKWAKPEEKKQKPLVDSTKKKKKKWVKS